MATTDMPQIDCVVCDDGNQSQTLKQVASESDPSYNEVSCITDITYVTINFSVQLNLSLVAMFCVTPVILLHFF